MNREVMFSSSTDNWGTPQELFDELNSEFHFTLDPCANEENHKCKKYFTKCENGLVQDWGGKLFFAIHPMVRTYTNGLKSVIWKGVRNIQRLFC